MFRFYLDGNLVDDPIGWDGFQETIEFDDDLKGLLSKFRSKLTFFGDGYEYLRQQFDIQGYCHLVELEIREKCGADFLVIFEGYIFLSDVKFQIKEKCLAECSIQDRSFSAKINNNKSKKAVVNVARSQNGIAITAAASITTNFRDPITLGTTRTVVLFDLEEVFRMMIEFMTDGTVGFASSWLSNLPATERIGICTGLNIRTGSGTAPEISFKELFEEVHKKYNTYFAIERVTSGMRFRLEQRGYFTNQTTGINLFNIKHLSQSFDNQLLYSHIVLGSDDTQDIDAPNTNIPQVTFLTFLDETFNIQGDCNIDRKLDLKSEWQIDTNVIEHALNDVDDNYDDDVFLVQYESATPQTSNVDYLGLSLPVYGFNNELRNGKVAERFNMQGPIALYLGNGNDECSVLSVNDQPISQTGFPVIISPVQFANEVSDPNNNFNQPPTTPFYAYVCPATGVYVFSVEMFLNVPNNEIWGPRTFDLKLIRRDAGGIFIEEFVEQFRLPLIGIYLVALNADVYMNATDYVEVEVELYQGDIFNAPILIKENAKFECVSTVTGGGIYQPKPAGNYFTSLYDFDQPISRETWNTLKSDLAQTVNFDERNGWIKQVVHNYETKRTTWKLLNNG